MMEALRPQHLAPTSSFEPPQTSRSQFGWTVHVYLCRMILALRAEPNPSFAPVVDSLKFFSSQFVNSLPCTRYTIRF